MAGDQYDKPDKKQPRIPDMIKNHNNAPRPKPPGLGQAADHREFQRQWNAEMKAVQQIDPFDEINKQHTQKSVTNAFNLESDVVNAQQAKLDQTDDQLASVIDQYMDGYDHSRHVSPYIRESVERINQQALSEEATLPSMQNNATPLNKPLTLGDAFDQVKNTTQNRDQGLSR